MRRCRPAPRRSEPCPRPWPHQALRPAARCRVSPHLFHPPLSVKVSNDDGRTWHTAEVGVVKGVRVLHLTHPGTATSVSFRASLGDGHGNAVKETIHRACRLVQ